MFQIVGTKELELKGILENAKSKAKRRLAMCKVKASRR